MANRNDLARQSRRRRRNKTVVYGPDTRSPIRGVTVRASILDERGVTEGRTSREGHHSLVG